MSYKVKNWSTFQHFKNRCPPWIKLYREILNQLDINMISDCSFRVLIGCWLLASEDKTQTGLLPDTKTIAFRLRKPETVILKAFSELSPFIYQDDINVISTRYQHDAPETETETEGETETETEKKRHNFLCFDKCWKMFRSYGVKKTALKYWKMLKPEDHADIEAKIPAYLQAVDAGRKQMQFEGWINPATRKWDVDWGRAAKIEKATGKQPLINTYHETNDLNQPLNF